MSKWVDINLPYKLNYTDLPIKEPVYPAKEVFSKTIKKFGKSIEDARKVGNWELSEEICNYTDNLECVLTYTKNFGIWFNYVAETLPLSSFFHSGHHKTGTAIEVLEDGEFKRYLIGDKTNNITWPESIVLRYKVLDINYD